MQSRDSELIAALNERMGSGGEKRNQPITRRLEEFPLLRNLDAVIVTLSAVTDVTALQTELKNTAAGYGERRLVGMHLLDSTHILIVFSQ